MFTDSQYNLCMTALPFNSKNNQTCYIIIIYHEFRIDLCPGHGFILKYILYNYTKLFFIYSKSLFIAAGI